MLPAALAQRRDKMGFPVPLKEWLGGELRDMVSDIFQSTSARTRPFVNGKAVLATLDSASRYSRKTWGLLCLELWHQAFHDKASGYRAMADEVPGPQRQKAL